MDSYSIVLYKDDLYAVHGFKMNRAIVVLKALDSTYESYVTTHVNNCKDLDITICDIPGCTTLADVREKFPEYAL